MGIWACGLISIWAHGILSGGVPIDIASIRLLVGNTVYRSRNCRPMDTKAFGKVGPWAYGTIGIWAYRHMGMWAYAHMGIWACGHVRICAQGHVGSFTYNFNGDFII